MTIKFINYQFNPKLENFIKNYKICKKEVESFMSMKEVTRNEIGRLVKEVRISENKDVEIYFNFRELTIVSS